MTRRALNELEAFARGDLPPAEFEQWFLGQRDLEPLLGDTLHWALTSGDYRNRDEVWRLRGALAEVLRPHANCECPTLRNLCAVPMGGDRLDERVFATIRPVRDHGGMQWWLYLSRCTACGQHWMVAQDERIYDEYLLRRIDPQTAQRIEIDGEWPAEFMTYEDVLKTCRTFAAPPWFLDHLPSALVWTAHELRQERPGITIDEIGLLLGIAPSYVEQLLATPR